MVEEVEGRAGRGGGECPQEAKVGCGGMVRWAVGSGGGGCGDGREKLGLCNCGRRCCGAVDAAVLGDNVGIRLWFRRSARIGSRDRAPAQTQVVLEIAFISLFPT